MLIISFKISHQHINNYNLARFYFKKRMQIILLKNSNLLIHFVLIHLLSCLIHPVFTILSLSFIFLIWSIILFLFFVQNVFLVFLLIVKLLLLLIRFFFFLFLLFFFKRNLTIILFFLFF